MTETQNFKLKKPDYNDIADVGQLNENWDTLDKMAAGLDSAGKVRKDQIPDIDCGMWDTDPVSAHDYTTTAHTMLLVDGNNTEAVDSSETLEEHMANPSAHQNLIIDGNAGQ